MLKKEVNIRSFQKNLTEIFDAIMEGEEIIITKSDIPIAKLSPIESPVSNIKANYFSAKVNQAKRALSGEAPENWFG